MRFATDPTLGKLSRHLRAAGFDTLYPHQRPIDDFFNGIDGERIILTRTKRLLKRLKNRPHLFIRDNDPFQQMQQVVDDLGIRRSDLHPLSRCLTCNLKVHRVDKAELRGRVPAYVWQNQSIFHQCDRCQRIYWAGSHHDRMWRRLGSLFENTERANP
jgi:uncharacterized protein with PIN domain